MLVTLRVRTSNENAGERAVRCALAPLARRLPSAVAGELAAVFQAEAGADLLDEEDAALLREKLEGWLVTHAARLRAGEAPVFEYVRMNPPPRPRPQKIPQKAAPRPTPPLVIAGHAPPAPEDDLFARIEASVDWQGK